MEKIKAGSEVVKMRALGSGTVGLACCFSKVKSCHTLNRLLNPLQVPGFFNLENGDVNVDLRGISGD